MRRPCGAAAMLALLAAACGAPGSQLAPMTQLTPGTYSGTDAAGGLQWTISQDGVVVTGTGTFLATGSTNVAPYTLRGTFAGGELELRLVGAPGDSDADSVWFNGVAARELYSGAAFSGMLNGSSVTLYGSLSMYYTPP